MNEFKATHEIKTGHGYWDTTEGYGIGGCFRRCSKVFPLQVELVQEPQFVKGYGYLAEFRSANNQKFWVSKDCYQAVN